MIAASEQQIKALIRLLSDEDERIAHTIGEKLAMVGDPAVPYLQEASGDHPEMAGRIARVLDEIRSVKLEEAFKRLAGEAEGLDMLQEGAFLIARYEYPDVDAPAYVRQLDAIAEGVQNQLASCMSTEERVKALNHYLFTDLKFHGNTKNYYETDNSFLNRVIDRRTGIPISLSVLYLLIAWRVNLPACGVGMPGHFLVKINAGDYERFVDCFNAGALLSEKDCARFLMRAGYGFEASYLEQSSIHAILARMLRNLASIYQGVNDAPKAERLTRFIEIFSHATKPHGRKTR